ncbi:MAG TPA: hypothetical protein VH500_01795 [Nitrososphaeraceae archaeon]|jgi:hypothetical protein
MKNVKVKIILRAYPKTFEWEGLERWNEHINKEIEGLDIISVTPIGMDGVLIVYSSLPSGTEPSVS